VQPALQLIDRASLVIYSVRFSTVMFPLRERGRRDRV